MNVNYCSIYSGNKFKKSSKSKSSDESKEEVPILAGEAYFRSRLATINELKQNQETHPYPHKFNTTLTLKEFVKNYEHLQNEEIKSNKLESVAGRIHSIRRASSKLMFIDLRGDGFKLQVKASAQNYENLEKFASESKFVHRGDIIGVTGMPGRTKAGELSIISKDVS